MASVWRFSSVMVSARGLLDVFEHPGHEHGLAVAQGVDVDLGGARQILVDQDRGVAADGDGGLDVAGELVFVADDLHGAAAEHIGRTDHHGEANATGAGEGFLRPSRGGVDRLGDVQRVQQALETLAVFGVVDGVGRGAEDRNTGGFQRTGQLQGGLATELHDDAHQLAGRGLDGDQLQHVLRGQGLEI